MVVIDDDNEESDIASDLVDRQEGEKTVDINRPEDNRNTDSDSMDSDVHRKHENINKRKIGSLENDKTAVVKKKSKRDFNKDSEIQPSEKSIEESVDDRDDWTDIGRRLQSRAGYGDHFDSGKPSTHKSPIAIPVSDSVLVIASHPCVFPLKGVVTIQAVVGTASVMEYNLVPGSQGYDVYSPDCNSLVTVSTVKGVTKTKTAVNQVDSMLGINDKTVINLLKNSLNDSKPFVVLKFDKLKTTLCSFISNFHPYTNIFKVDGDKTLLNKQLLPLSVKMPGEDMDVPEISVSEQLQNVLDVWQENLIQQNEGVPVMLVCGGKDSGKSTSNRLLINSTLNRCKSVYYLECDIGQTEFTPPGVVSLVNVTNPVLGPPFTHQRKAVCSYHYGSVSPKDNADLYMGCVQLCVQEYKRVEQKTPLIVNTMGWMKGLGWQLLLDIVRLVSPSIMVQLMSYQVSQNVPPITVEDLEQTSWTELSKIFKGENIERKMERIPTFLSLEGPISTSYNFRLKSTDYRNLSILSHLGANLEPGLTLTSMTPFTVSWKDVAIHMCHVQVPKSQVMCALNANMVALCEGDITKAELTEDDGPLFLKKNKQPFRWIGYETKIMPRKKKEIKPEKISNDTVADQTVKRKSRVAKRNIKNTVDLDNTSTSSDTSKPGRGKTGSNIKRKDRNGGKIVSSIEQNNNLEEGVSEYFSSSSRCNPSLKGKKVKQEGRKSSYASKARNLKNCSIILSDVGSDEEFEASTINYNSPGNKRSTSSKNKSSQGKTSKTNTVKVMNADTENDNIKSSIEEKNKDIEAKDPSANSEKVNKGNNVKSGRKRKDTIENDLEIKKPKLKATKPKKSSKGKEVKTDKRGIKEKTARKVKIENTKNIDTDQDTIDNLKHVEGAAKQKENVTDTQNEASGSSDDEMMDVEEDDNLMTVSKTSLPTSVDHSDAMAVLMHMEGPKQNDLTEKPSTSKASDVDDNEHLSEDDDEEESDWEDVADHHGNSPKKSQLPSGPVEITLDAPVIYRKKKKKVEFDLQAYFRRQINKFKREVAMDIHKVHLLFLLARCQYLNNLCMEETVQAQVFSITLVTKELKLPPTKSCTESHVTQVLYCIQEKQHYLSDIMAESFSKVSTQLKITLICVVLLRQVGFLTRFVTSLQPVPFKESGSKSSSSKKGKSPKSSKGKEKGTTESKRSTSKSANSKSGKKNISIKSEQSVKTEQIKTEKMEIDEDVSNNRKGPKGGKLVKRRISDRKCSKVSKNAYKEDASFDDEKLSDDNDDDYVPNDDNTDDDQENKHKRKRSKIKKETKISSDENDSIKEENLSDDDFEEDSILIRTQQLKKETSKSKNRKALSSDSDPDNIGVDNWAEVYIEREKKWLCVDCVKLQVLKPYEIENKATQPVSYVVGITQEGYIRDVTARYASKWLTETRKHRVDNEWWDETLQPYKCPDKARDQQEDHELSSQLQQRLLPTSIGAFKSHPLYVLKRHLLKFEALYPDTAIPVGYIRGEPVYARECVHTLHSRENWLKEGRAVRVGEEPYKFVKSRPKWGKVPRNAHGNVEMFLPSMLPAGTVHLKVPALNKVAKKLDIDCAPAMVGWDHHCGFSHPLMDGWIVCEEYKDILLAAWDEEQEIIREKEQQVSDHNK